MRILCLEYVFDTRIDISSIKSFLLSYFYLMANIVSKLCGLHLLAYILVLVGAINW